MKNIFFLLIVLMAASCTQPETIYLDEIDISNMTSGWGKAKINKSITRAPITINGVEFERGIGTHATSAFLLDLGGNALEFSALVGVDDASVENGSIQFFLIGDRKIVWQSDIMTKGTDATDCRVTLKE